MTNIPKRGAGRRLAANLEALANQSPPEGLIRALNAALCPDCGTGFDSDGWCPQCNPCPHDDLDHGICLDCEADLTPDLMARAYDRAKALRRGE